MPKRLGLGSLILCLSTSVLITGCSTRTQTMESMEARLTALEDAQYNFQARQESLNQWKSTRLSALEAKHPEIKVPPPPAFMARETMLPESSVPAPLQGEVVDAKPGEAVVAPSAIKPSPVNTPDANAGMVVYHAPAKVIPSTPPAPAPVTATEQTAAPLPQQPSNQAQTEAPGGRVIDPNTPPAPLHAAEPREVKAPKTQTASKPSASPSGEKGEYATALAKIERGQLAQGREGMDSFMDKYPSSSLVPNALYWKGESYYSEKKYDEAILSFKDIVSRFPKSNKAPDAMLKMGMSYQKMGDSQNARFYLQLLLDDYPSASSAGLAKKHLAGIPE